MLSGIKAHQNLYHALLILFSVLAGHIVWTYLRLPLQGCFSFLLGAGIFFLFRNAVRVPWHLRAFSLLFALAIVLAYHIVYTGGLNAPATKNYITDYSAFDIAAFAVLALVTEQALVQGLQKLESLSSKLLPGAAARNTHTHTHTHTHVAPENLWDRLMQYPLWVYAGIMVLGWTPWLLTWYPGFIFWDSVNSVMQALGRWGLNNHHPVFYTLWIKLWLVLGIKLHSVNVGCLLYTVSQMILMAFTLSYAVRWMYRHSMHPAFCVFTIAWFALTPFFAQNNTAMWKDPLFSAVILLMALQLYDICLSQAALRARNVLTLLFLFLVLCFIRNNGAWLLLFTGMGFAVIAFCYRKCLEKKRIYLPLTGIMLFVAIASIVIQGPVFAHLRWSPSYAETVPVPLNQMARIVYYNGTMSEEERAFMDNLLPLELYKDAYAPCLIDKYKWFKGKDGKKIFNDKFLASHKKEFFKTYFSMIANNPRLAFESWQLQTAGFWAPTHCTFWNQNMPQGNMKSLTATEKYGHGIWQRNLLENRFTDTRKLFSELDATFPLGAVFWLVLLTAVVALKKGHLPALVAVLPLLSLSATLFLAAPEYYWPRYGYALTLMLPVVIFLLLQLCRERKDPAAG